MGGREKLLKFALAGGVGRGDGSEIKAVNLINHHHLLLQNYYYYYICLWHWTGEGVKKADLESFWHPKTIFFSWLLHTYTAAGILLLALLLLLLPQVDMKTRRWNHSLGVIVRVRGMRGKIVEIGGDVLRCLWLWTLRGLWKWRSSSSLQGWANIIWWI